jgi:lipopolysaccharide export system protein LptA
VERPSGSRVQWPAACRAWICLAAVLILLSAGGVLAADPGAANQVHITADRLLADMGGRTAEFIGDVRAEQGTTVITAKRLKVFYAPSTGDHGPAASAAQGDIERLEASGQVKILFDDQVAEADEAVYTAADRILVLTGKAARITQGPNTVVGGRITLHRDENRITVEKPADGRVQAVFVDTGKGLQ